MKVLCSWNWILKVAVLKWAVTAFWNWRLRYFDIENTELLSAVVLFLVTFLSAVCFCYRFSNLLDQFINYLSPYLLILAIVVLGWLFFYHVFNDSFLYHIIVNFVFVKFVGWVHSLKYTGCKINCEFISFVKLTIFICFCFSFLFVFLNLLLTLWIMRWIYCYALQLGNLV